MAGYESDGSTYDGNWTGLIEIGEQCVFLTGPRGESRSLVVWPDRYTRWDPDGDAIVVLKPGSAASLTSGMALQVGGGGMALDAIESVFGWIASPRPECLTEGTWLAGGDVRLESPGPSTGSWYGPLAVRVPAGVSYDGVGLGTLVITDECAFLEEEGGGRNLIVWPESPTAWVWDPETREVVSLRVGSDERAIRFESGDTVRLGGADVDPSTQALILEDTDWVAAPNEGCMTPTVFFSNGEISPGDSSGN